MDAIQESEPWPTNHERGIAVVFEAGNYIHAPVKPGQGFLCALVRKVLNQPGNPNSPRFEVALPDGARAVWGHNDITRCPGPGKCDIARKYRRETSAPSDDDSVTEEI